MNWMFLFIGGLFEAAFALSLGKAQQSEGKTLLFWLGCFVVSVSISMYLLYCSMGGEKPIPVGTAYAVWGAIGAVTTVLAGMYWLHEPITFWRLFFISTLILSVVGLKLVST